MLGVIMDRPMTLTAEQKKAYLADPTKCPYCGSHDICSTINNSERDECENCGAEWGAIYTLTDITITREPEAKG